MSEEEEGGIGVVGLVVGGVGCLVLVLGGAAFFVFGARQATVRMAKPAPTAPTAPTSSAPGASISTDTDGSMEIVLTESVAGKQVELRGVFAADGSLVGSKSGRYEDGARVRELDAVELARIEAARN